MKTEIGVFTIGPNKGLLKRFRVPFTKNFQKPPVFVASTLQGEDYPGDLPDTFAVSVKAITKEAAAVQVWKVEHPGETQRWNQNLRLCWIAMSDEG